MEGQEGTGTAESSQAEPGTPKSPRERARRLTEVAGLFLRLGFTAFGGPAAHIAMMREEVVLRRGWIGDERFVDLLGITNLIPGPNSTEMAIYLGYLRAGWPGLLIGGICFIGPAMLIVLALAWAYVSYGSLPQVGWLFYGIKPVVVAIIAQALWGLCRTVLKGIWPIVLALLVLALYLLGVNTLILLFGGGLLFGLIRGGERWYRSKRNHKVAGLLVSLSFNFNDMRVRWLQWFTTLPIAGVAAAAVPFSMLTLFMTFLKIGAILYGSGYVLLAFLRSDFVLSLHWLTDRQLLDAVSIGQFTPGPVFTTATFIGYLVGGWQGALLATLSIFLPSFVFIALIHPVATRIRRSPWTAPLLDGVNAAALVSFAVLMRFKINSVWLILAGAAIGLVRFWLL